MSKQNNYCGPAFPVTPTDRGGQCGPTEYGMSLRDWFAGQALAGMWANSTDVWSIGDMADLAYKQADAMLAERDAKGVLACNRYLRCPDPTDTDESGVNRSPPKV